MHRKTYVLGSINIDLVITTQRLPEAGETLHGEDYFENLGGKGLNQARAIHRLGSDVRMMAAIGDDVAATRVLTSLSSFGLDTRGIECLKEESTGRAIIIRTDAENRIILHTGANKTRDTTLLLPLHDAKEGDIFLTQMEMDYHMVLLGLKAAKEKNLLTILNLAPAQQDVRDLLAYSDYLIVNQSELKILTGVYPYSLDEGRLAFKMLQEQGLLALVVTLGADGVLYFDNNEAWHQGSFKIKPVDTTGAGDAFVGAFTYQMSQGNQDMKNVIKFASAAGAYACLSIGVEQAMASKKDIEILMEEGKKDE